MTPARKKGIVGQAGKPDVLPCRGNGFRAIRRRLTHGRVTYNDRGKIWTNIGGDLPERGSAYTIAVDHVTPDLLFVDTEFGVFASRDGGQHWQGLKAGMPTIAVRDLEIQRRESDLVVGTFGG